MQFGNFHAHYNHSYALVIGINKYEKASPLAYATNDADEIASVLISDWGFPKDQVTLLKNKDATKESIIEKYLDFANSASQPDDRVIFFFAGHGFTTEGYQGQVGYLVPSDGDPKKLSTLIRWDDLTRNADLIPAKHILFILDACFSGLAFKRAVPPGSQRFLSEMLQRRARQVITAGKADQVVADGGGHGGRNSIFTGHLLEGLRGKAINDGILTANGLMHYVYQELAQDGASQQTPHYGHIDGDGDFVFLTLTDEQTQLENDKILEVLPEQPALETFVPGDFNTKLFSNANGYSDSSHPNFGRNHYSNKLGFSDFENNNQEEKAFSWLALVVEPSGHNNPEFNLVHLAKRFENYQAKGENAMERFYLPRNKVTSLNSVILFDELNSRSTYWKKYVRIDKFGNIEFCDSYQIFYSYKGQRRFRYVPIIGLIWQYLFFSKSILEEYGYRGGARLLVNLIGTRDTILVDFSKEAGKENKAWAQPGEGIFPRLDPSALTCQDSNIQLQYNFICSSINAHSSKQIIDDVAEKLGLAYNHQTEPRCFNYGTDIFPWQQFVNGQYY